ncbi:hypothetical protein ACIBL5_17345 [Streptomyces sp. NPDC050516]|uniref:hypothetical protein n=1 Tax=Streptomyces sp. NPDC050516 TaxID=3365621 RepID=UPI0037BBA55B
MAVGEDWQRDVLRELNGGDSASGAPQGAGAFGSASAAPQGAGPAEGSFGSAAQPGAGDSAAQPDAGNPAAPSGRPYTGPAEGTFRIRPLEPRQAEASRDGATPAPSAGVGALSAANADVSPTPGSQHPNPGDAGLSTSDPRQASAAPHPHTAGTLDAIAAARAAAQYESPAPDAASAAPYGSGAPEPQPAELPMPTPHNAPADRPATLPELRIPGGRDAAVPMATPESVPTVDPRLAVALGRPVHGDSVAKRAGRSVRKLGSSAAQDVAEESRIGRELQQPVTTGRVIAVTSIRGGVGKTTVAALLARSFNHYRHDPVLALEADGALGTLPVRLGAESVRWSCADLADILTPAMQLTDVTGYLVPITDGGWLLPASQGRLGAPLSMRTYRTVTLALRRYFAVTVVDCETLPGEVARTAMDTAHARIVVAPMTAEGVGGTRVVLDWLAHLPHSALATTVVALTANSPDMTLDLKAATAHLREAGVTVLSVPYDRHLAQGGPIQTALLGRDTRQAAVALAAEAMERAVRVR